MRLLVAILLFAAGAITKSSVIAQSTAPSAGGMQYQKAAKPKLITSRQQAVRSKSAVQFGLSVNPDTVTIGEHFIVIARLRIAKDAQLTIPTGGVTDSAIVDMVTEPVVTDTAAGEFRDIRIVWKLAAWRTGAVKLGLQDIIIDGSIAPVSEAKVFVRSVLPPKVDGDTTTIVPKPPRDVIRPFTIPWLWILIALAVLGLSYIIWRYIKRRREIEAISLRWASKELDLIDSMKLLESGRDNEYVERVSNVLRQYLSRDINGADISMTSTEMLKSMESLSAITVREAGDIFASADVVKFANQSTTAASAREMMANTRSLIASIYAATRPEADSKEAGK